MNVICDNIRIPRQNAFTLGFPFVQRYFSDGEVVDVDMDFDILSSINVSMQNSNGFAPKQYLNYRKESNVLYVDFPNDLSVGTYDIIISAMYKGDTKSSLLGKCFSIVEWNDQSDWQNYIQGSPILTETSVFVYFEKIELIGFGVKIRKNGEYSFYAKNGTGYNRVGITIDVPQPKGTLTIKENGTYNIADYESVIVNVTDTPTRTDVVVPLSSGVFNNGVITWYAGDGVIRLTQTKGNGSTGVSGSYITQPRLYKGHILQVEGIGVKLVKIEIYYDGNYYGNNITAGTTVANNVVADDPQAINRVLSTMPNGKDTFTADNARPTIYIQNTATGSNVQFRPVEIIVTYEE